MAIFPEYDYEMDEEVTEEVASESVKIGRTPLFDFETGQYVIRDGKIVECTQEEAIRQWVGFLIKTPAERFEVYKDTEFGTYIHNLIGWKDAGFVASEIKRELEEKCIENRAISGVKDFDVTKNGGAIHISFTVIKADNEEVEVEVDV